MKILRLLALSASLLLPYPALWAQEEESASGELLENFFRDNEQANESDAQIFLENLDNLRSNPLDINKLLRDDLTGLRLLSELQVENFMRYREEFGPFLSKLELQAIPSWEVSDIRLLTPFLTVNTTLDQRSRSLLEGLIEGEDEIIVRWGRPLPPRYDTDNVAGMPNTWAIRVRHSFDNRMRFGFTAENDPGEAFFKGNNRRGFDFYSGHLFFQNLNKTVRTVAIGDYSAVFGQGLLLQTGFAPGKSAEAVNITRGGRKINAYAAFGEAFFLRGAAATLGLGKRLELTVLFSGRRRDGNIRLPDSLDQEDQEIFFTSLQTSGLHRTPGEIEDKGAVRELLGGFSLAYNMKRGHVAVNGMSLGYDEPFRPTLAPYRQFVFAGQRLTAFSADYNWRRRNLLLFGEAARSDNGGMAAVNGLLLGAERRVTLALLHRALARNYQSVYAAPFAEVSGAANEQGLYTGVQIRPAKKWQIDAYADLWRHPWLRFGVSAPSNGSEYLGRVVWTPLRGFSSYVLWQTETKERDAESGGLAAGTRHRFRVHSIYKVSTGVEFRSRVEWTRVTNESVAAGRGFFAFQEAVWKPRNFPLSGTVRYAIFDTENFDTRVFAFENDLFAAVSIPAFAGRGSRYFLNLTWRVNGWLRLESRVEQTIQRLAVTSTGQTGKQTSIKLQARMTFK